MRQLLEWLFRVRRQKDGGPKPGPVRVLYKRYKMRIDLTGKNLILLGGGAERDGVKKEIAVLVEPKDMEERWVSEEDATAWMIGEVADEIHEFKHAFSGASRLRRILFRNGHVIEMMFG